MFGNSDLTLNWQEMVIVENWIYASLVFHDSKVLQPQIQYFLDIYAVLFNKNIYERHDKAYSYSQLFWITKKSHLY